MGGHVKGYQSLSGLIQRIRKIKAPRLSARSATKNTLAYLVFSSGTSGLPKGTPFFLVFLFGIDVAYVLQLS